MVNSFTEGTFSGLWKLGGVVASPGILKQGINLMNSVLLAQVSTWGIANWAIFIIVVAGIVGIVFVVTKQMGIPIPDFFVKILWIILAAVIGIIAIKFLVQVTGIGGG